MGSNKQHLEIKTTWDKGGENEVTGILGGGRLSQNSTVAKLIRDRKARVEKFDSADIKTFFTMEER